MGAAPRPEALLRIQAEWMDSWKLSRLVKDEVLGSQLAKIGCPISQPAIANYRAGERTAPLGLLAVLLTVAGPDAIEVANVILRDFKLRAVRDVAATSSERGLLDEALDADQAVGRLVDKIREITADGVVTPEEFVDAKTRLDHAQQQLAEAEEALNALWTEQGHRPTPAPRLVP